MAANLMEGDVLDVARVEMVEAELDHMIRRRDEKRRQREGERDEEALWMASVRRYAERESTQLLWSWLRYHEGQMLRLTATYEHLIGRHRLEVERYSSMLGIADPGEGVR